MVFKRFWKPNNSMHLVKKKMSIIYLFSFVAINDLQFVLLLYIKIKSVLKLIKFLKQSRWNTNFRKTKVVN